MLEHGIQVPTHGVHVTIPEAKKVLNAALDYFIGSSATWLPEYDAIVEWLTDNKRKGLFMYGDCGRGKSVIGKYVIPAVMLKYMNLVVSVYDMNTANASIDKMLAKRLISLDDVGVEDVAVNYGERRLAFAEVMDAVEKQGKLIIISTNLSAEQIVARYGKRTIDRIISTTKRIEFNGKSMRK